MNNTLSTLLLSAGVLLWGPAIAQNTAPYWSLSGNSNATTSSKLGTTNSNPLRILTNNVERLRIDAAGKVGIGTTTPIGKLTVMGSGGTPAASWISSGIPVFAGFGENTAGNADHILAMASNVPTARSVFLGRKARGTLAAPLPVQSNDYLLSLFASGYDGTAFQSSAAVNFFSDGPPSPGNVPARISFSTGSNAFNRTDRLQIGSTGDININNRQVFIRQSNGHVRIGTSTPSGYYSDDYFLDVRGSTYAEDTYIAVVGQGLGNVGMGVGGFGNWGVYGSGTEYGIWGNGGSAGIYGTGLGPYAGYFNGDVFTSGMYQGSDGKLKEHVAEVSSAVGIIARLHPKIYNYRHDGSFKQMNLPTGTHYGLIAQDVEEVLPNLVKNSTFDTRMATPPGPGSAPSLRSSGEVVKFKAVNYTELIPILVKATQEQEEHIQKQDSLINQQQMQIDRLEKLLARISHGQSAFFGEAGSLGQNIPNPGASITTIPIQLPSGSDHARLTLMDNAGRLVRNIPLSASGNVQLNTSLLANGAYHYSLIINNHVVDTKQMIIAR